jgi:hypothetical protein
MLHAAVKAFCEGEGLDPSKAIVGAGAAMFLHGLREEINDVDLFHPDLVGTPHRKVWYEGFEFDFGGFALPPEMTEYVEIEGLRVSSLEALLAFYRHLNREKDQTSIALLERLV